MEYQSKRIAPAVYMETSIEATEVRKRTPVYVGPTGPGHPIPGVLLASIHVEGPFIAAGRVWCRIVAGGAAGAYAWRQHEEMDWFHSVGQAKYIESVIFESRDSIKGRVAARIKSTLLTG